MFRKIIASLIIFPLLIVPLFCCCIKQAHADTEVEHCNDSDADHSATHDHADHNSSHSCDCHSFSTAVETVAIIHIAFSSFPNVFPAIDVVPLKSLTYLKGSVGLASLGPPIGVSSAVPLYIKFHSLRI